MTVDEWMSGVNKEPLLVSLKVSVHQSFAELVTQHAQHTVSIAVTISAHFLPVSRAQCKLVLLPSSLAHCQLVALPVCS